jgi:signal transduction histidine kinase/ligand-binding sensor domain-containing protein
MRGFLGFIMLYFFISAAWGQTVDLRFVGFRQNSRLSSVYVNKIEQDKLGFIWIGAANGLQRFDGSEFEYYLTNEQNSFGIEESGIQDLFADLNGDMWISLNSKLCRYSYTNDSISVIADELSSGGMSSAHVTGLMQGSDSTLYVSESDAVYRFNYTKQTFKKVFAISDGAVSAMCFDGRDNIWMSPDSGNKLYVFNPESKEYAVVEVPDGLLKAKSITDIIFHKQKIWIATDGAGIIQHNLQTGKFKSYDLDNEYAYNVRQLYVDRDSFLWMVDFSGLKLYVEDRDFFQGYYPNDEQEYSISSNVAGIFQDRDKNYWTNYYPGGVDFSSQPRGFVRFDTNVNSPFCLTENNVSAITEDKYGNLYMGNPFNGIDVFKWIEGRTVTYKHDPGNPNSLGKGGVHELFTDSKSRIWVGTYWGGLQQFDYENDTFINYRANTNNPNSIAANDVRAVDEDYAGALWVCVHGKGVDRFNPASGTFSHYNSENSGLANDYTFDVTCTSDSAVWVATSWGLSVLRNGQDEFVNYQYSASDDSSISSNSVVTVFEDRKKRIWVGTPNGLNQYLPESDNFKRITAGFNDVNIVSITDDDRGNLWMGTQQGLVCYNPDSGQIINLTKDDGLTSNNFVQRAVFFNGKSTLFFGTLHGITYFNYNNINLDIKEPDVFITDVKIYNESQKPYNSDVLDKSIEIDSVLNFNYDDDVISFTYSALKYTNTDNIRFAYYLEGFEDEWNYVGNRRTATYTNLKPGNYTFRVKATAGAGTWSSDGQSVHLVVAPPWWYTWWFISFLAFTVIAIVVAVVKIRERSLTRQNLLLEKNVQNRTKEILKKNELLEEQKKELEEANKMKMRFFKIIAHDLRSPLSSMIQLVSLLKERTAGFDIENGKLINIIDGTANNMYHMLEEMMIWGNSEAESYNFNKEEVDLKDAVEYSFQLLADLSEVKQVGLKHDVSDKVFVYTDLSALRIILRNILSNAIKFSYPKSEITVTANEKGEDVIICIADQGMGMTKTKANRIFEKYNNKSEKGTSGEHGTGLGLLIVKEIIDKLEAQIWVETELGHGTSFYIKLPMC